MHGRATFPNARFATLLPHLNGPITTGQSYTCPPSPLCRSIRYTRVPSHCRSRQHGLSQFAISRLIRAETFPALLHTYINIGTASASPRDAQCRLCLSFEFSAHPLSRGWSGAQPGSRPQIDTCTTIVSTKTIDVSARRTHSLCYFWHLHAASFKS